MVTDDRMKYTPLAVSDYLDLDDDGKENEGGNKASNTLWIKDLELTHGSSKYVPPEMLRVMELIVGTTSLSSQQDHRPSFV